MVAQASQVIQGQRRWSLRFDNGYKWLRHGVLIVVLGIVLFVVVLKLLNPATLPIKKIRVQGALVHVNEPMLQEVMSGNVQGGFFNLDVNLIRQSVEKLPWVKTARVRKVWPDTVVVTVVEQQATAKWASGGLVNRKGMVFQPKEKSYPAAIPLFSAPQGMSQTVMEHYRGFNQQLAAVGLEIQEIYLDARRAIKLKLNNGIQLVLGREAQAKRLQRFVKVYSGHLQSYAAEIKRIDLRYSNGMAVQLRTRKVIQQG